MYCPNCGRKNKGRHEYCPGCGQKLNITDSEPEKEIDWRIVFIAVFAVLFIICGIILLELYRREREGGHEPGAGGTQASVGETGKTGQPLAGKSDDPGDTGEEPGQPKPENLDIEDGAVTFGKHSYYIFEGNCDSWGDAEKYCESRGGYLAVINNEEEDNFLFEHMCSTGRRAAYFGLSDIENKGDWKWVGNRKSSYKFNWGVNDDGQQEPNKASVDERYAEYDANLQQGGGTWNDCGFGRDTKAYICEWDFEP